MTTLAEFGEESLIQQLVVPRRIFHCVCFKVQGEQET